MCSGAVWVVLWVAVCKKVTCTCKGLFASRRASWVSVTILVGIRFKNQDAQRTDMLAHRALLVHDKYIFLLQFLVSRQVFRDDKRHREGLLVQNTFIIKVSPAKSNKKSTPGAKPGVRRRLPLIRT